MRKFIFLVTLLTLSFYDIKPSAETDDITGYEVVFENLDYSSYDHSIFIDEETKTKLLDSIKRNDTYFILPYEVINISKFHIITITKI